MRFPPYFYFRFGQKWMSDGVFSPVMRVLRCVVPSKVAQSATGRQPTTGMLLRGSTGNEYSMSHVTGGTFLPSRSFQIVNVRDQTAVDPSICGFRQTGSGCLSSGSSFVRPEVASSGPVTTTPITPSVSITFVHMAWGFLGVC